MDNLLTMSAKELSRLEVIQRLNEKPLKQKEAAQMLDLSVRQIKRMVKAYRENGAQGLMNRQRGQPSYNQLDRRVAQKAIDLLHQRYPDFGPTLAREKLVEVHGLERWVESVRQLMIEEGLWKPKKACNPAVLQIATPN